MRLNVLACTLAIVSTLACLPTWYLPPTGPARAEAAVGMQEVVSGLDAPLYVTNAHDGSGRLFIVEQAGVVKVAQPGSPPTVFLDIRDRVLYTDLQGLLGFAVHPAFGSNGRFFVHYTRKPDGVIVIAEYRVSAANPDVADTSETVLLTVDPGPWSFHDGGMIEFGPDGFLYIAIGDGAGEDDPDLRGQDVTTQLGKLLRIDVDHPAGGAAYSSPPSNPFVGITGADEIYAYGLRNPWRFSFDRATGQLYLADVGQDEREEVDIITSGGNYGWSVWEGTRCNDRYPPDRCTTAGFVFPIAEYAHADGRCAVTGGYVYRGTLGTVTPGAYVFGDLCTGEIFQLDGSGAISVLLHTGFTLVSFGEDEAGELYVVDLKGSIYRLVGTGLAAAVLPGSRSVPVGTTATAFATMIWTGSEPATDCSITPISQVPATFLYQTTDSTTNALTGSPNSPVAIPAGGSQSFLIAFTPTAAFAPTDIQLSFACANTPAAPLRPQLDALLLSSSSGPAPDVVALSATLSGDGVVNVPAAGTGSFSVATVNLGAADSITASAEVANGPLPVNVLICQTDPGTGSCLGALAPAVTLRIDTRATPTFAVFVASSGSVPFDPSTNRVNVRFTDSTGAVRGLTSVAVRTQ
jgi:glucose/arabinose dehydrogenase